MIQLQLKPGILNLLLDFLPPQPAETKIASFHIRFMILIIEKLSDTNATL